MNTKNNSKLVVVSWGRLAVAVFVCCVVLSIGLFKVGRYVQGRANVVEVRPVAVSAAEPVVETVIVSVQDVDYTGVLWKAPVQTAGWALYNAEIIGYKALTGLFGTSEEVAGAFCIEFGGDMCGSRPAAQ